MSPYEATAMADSKKFINSGECVCLCGVCASPCEFWGERGL